MNVTEKRRSFLINVMYFAVLIGLFFLFFKYAFGICLPLLTALFVAAGRHCVSGSRVVFAVFPRWHHWGSAHGVRPVCDLRQPCAPARCLAAAQGRRLGGRYAAAAGGEPCAGRSDAV